MHMGDFRWISIESRSNYCIDVCELGLFFLELESWEMHLIGRLYARLQGYMANLDLGWISF